MIQRGRELPFCFRQFYGSWYNKLMIYLIHGDDYYLVEDKLSEFTKKYPKYAIYSFDGSNADTPVALITEAARSQSLFGEASLIIVRHPSFFYKKMADNEKKELNPDELEQADGGNHFHNKSRSTTRNISRMIKDNDPPETQLLKAFESGIGISGLINKLTSWIGGLFSGDD